ncbi:hypothetical protein BCR43DRAFT_441722 [Syncephalastrum racemosum]|uniref:RING-type domain-containing protein n=1 Tax=Syncephalastrum racemosum TaxID=13706 RepID=A0A1X2HAP7_SYNRA|nr:hypothetical protein BCR43DRAFT_441722 [Syncephalastrum racemosum]
MSSSSSEYDDDDSLEYWLRRCSICLDHKFALCLESCRDQFCKACFQRQEETLPQISTVVHQSWGLGVTRIQCPVCHDTIRQSEWSKYVSPATVEKYEQYNQPYRPFSRFCAQCRAQVSPCQSPRTQGESRQTRILRIAHDLEILEQDLMGHEDTLAVREAVSLFRNTCQQGSIYRVGRIQNLYKQLAPLLARVAHQHPHLYRRTSSISKQMVALELIPEAWKQAQFLHVAHFSEEACPECRSDMCLRCGEAAHGTISCSDYMKKELDSTTTPEVAATLRWKLEHTRSCPNCSVMINRDEGCNKVDCLYCGYQFCWSCRSGWSERLCGFYQCGIEKAESPSIQQADHKVSESIHHHQSVGS